MIKFAKRYIKNVIGWTSVGMGFSIGVLMVDKMFNKNKKDKLNEITKESE